ncbi:histidine phosphatase family protein [Phenylobacterium sp.]|uniref:histidine phosphatase family protein n=1 Tax=Phenylobacterium sp. TaxID=1871053 RepID=UPI00272FD442|nr:histidine phosphatase family protein [Phenylobacterium sp.]MDP1617733.1 histidine phosphatase family protein [Phenylobacterium sp.]MDP1987437.1 histidine phosphatase family protein [Phenylobacterium sp.]
MSELLLIKHAPPQITPEVISHRWVLSAEGRARCGWLVEVCRARGVTRLFASPEPKTLETAALVAMALGGSFRPLDGLQENDRTGLGFVSPDVLEARITAFFEDPDAVAIGAETARAVLARFQAAIDVAVASAPGEAIAVVTHGTAMSTFIAAHNAIDPLSLWRDLTLPGVAVLDAATYRLLEPLIPHPDAQAPKS